MKNRIIHGDNLVNLRKINTGSVDLIYIDPPFFTGKDWEIVDEHGLSHSFSDKWDSDIHKYMLFMYKRLKEAHRILKKTGSIYVHCDANAVGHLIVEMDKIFGMKNKRNIVNWQKTNQKTHPTKKFKDQADYLLFYSKSNNYTFHPQFNDVRITSRHRRDKDGRLFRDCIFEGKKFITKELMYKGKIIKPRKGFGFRWTQKRLDKELLTNAEPILLSKNNVYGLKQYTDVHKGEIVTNWWDDINPLAATAKERLGYTTQKPTVLVERIIKVSSNPGDTVLDFFAGSGTTGQACINLDRNYILMDRNESACRLMTKRFGLVTRTVENMVLTDEEIADLSGYEFQEYILKKFAYDYPNRIVIRGQGADGGYDGTFNGYPMEVKKTKSRASKNALTILINVMDKLGKEIGIFISYSGFSRDYEFELNRVKREVNPNLEVHSFSYTDIINNIHKPIIESLLLG